VASVRTFSLRDQMARFDWCRMAPCYDARLEHVIEVKEARG
jgi:hypothetical protein